LDWSEDGEALHSNSGDYELLFWDGTTGKQKPGGASAYRDEQWHTWSCVLGWPVQGGRELFLDLLDCRNMASLL